MANWTNEVQPFGANHTSLLSGLASDGVSGVIPVAVDPTTGAVLVDINAYSNPVKTMVYTGSTWTAQRTPVVFKTSTATTSGNTAIWTPASGKKFRLMDYVIYAPDDVQAGSAGDIDTTLNDAGIAIGLGFTFWAPDSTSTSNRHTDNSGPVQLGNGYLSAAANNVLNINLSTAIILERIRVTV